MKWPIENVSNILRRFRLRTYSIGGWFLIVSTVGISAVVLLCWIVAAFFEPINPDAGYYVPLARQVLRGFAPYRDFPSPYAPGGFYLLALAGDAVLGDPRLLRAYIFVVQILNGALFLGLLRKLKIERIAALFWSTLFVLWTFLSDGVAIVLEPFATTFLLASALIFLGRPGWARLVAGGLAVGIALLVKQFALLVLPGLFLLGLFSASGSAQPNGGMGGGRNRFRAGHVRDTWWVRLLLLALSAATPYLVFAVVTGQSFPDNLLHLATFGGSAPDSGLQMTSYETWGLKSAIRRVVFGGISYQVVVAALLAGSLLLALRPSRISLAIVVCFLGSLAQLYVRGYPHYLQFIIPWGVLILARLASVLGEVIGESTSKKRHKHAVVLLTALPFATMPMSAVYYARDTYGSATLSEQKALSDAVSVILPNKTDVLVINGPWLYLLADLTPPERDFGFLDAPSDDLLQSASHVVLVEGPFRIFPEREAQRWIEASGFDTLAVIPGGDLEALVYHKLEVGRGPGGV